MPNAVSHTTDSVSANTLTVWKVWVDGQEVATGGNGVWGAWAASCTSSCTTGTINVWQAWNSNTTLTSTPSRSAPPALTAEQQAARRAEADRQRAEWVAQAAERDRLALEANARAEELLVAHLAPAQRESYLRNKSFELQAASGRRYRIRHGWAGNVDALDEAGQVVERLCIHPREMCPNPDNMLAQKLLLEVDETRFRQIANISRVGGRAA